MRKNLKQTFCILLMLCMVLSTFTIPTVHGASEYHTVTFGGKKYSKRCITAKIGNVSVDTPIPGFIHNDTSLYAARYVFGNPDVLNTSYTYTKDTKKVTLERGNKTLVYTLNSRTAYLNGTKYTAPTAPVMATNEAGNGYVMVPGDFTATKLGLTYEWNNSSYYGSICVPSTSTSQTISYNSTSKTVTKLKAIVCDTVVTDDMYGYLESDYTMFPAKPLFKDTGLGASYEYTSSNKKVTINANGNKLIMTLNSTSATCNGTSLTLPVAPKMVFNHNNRTSYVVIPGEAVSNALGIVYEYDSSSKVATFGVDDSTNTIVNDAEYQTLKHNGKTTTFKRIKTRIGNRDITSDIDSYLADGYVMFSAKEILYNNSIFDTEYSYDSSTKKVTLKRGSHTIKATIDSTKATVDGSSVTLPVAPRLVYNYGDELSYVMFPAKTILAKLGLYYTYDSDTRIVKIRIPETDTEHTINHSGTTETLKKRYVKTDGVTISSPIPGFSYNSNTMVSAKYAFGNNEALDTSYSYSSADQSITFTHDQDTLVLYLNKTTASLNGTSVEAPVPSLSVYSHEKDSTYYCVPAKFVAEQLGFTYSWNSSDLTATINSGNTMERQILTPKTLLSASKSNYGICIKRPAEVDFGKVTAYDDYQNKKLYIYFYGGNYTTFIKNNLTVNTEPKKYSTGYNEEKNRTYFCIQTSSIRGFSIKEIDGSIYVRWAAPYKMYKNIICLDAGHGGSDSGATGNGFYEKTLTLKIVKAAKSYFDDNSNYKVYYTRLTDTYPSLSDRYTLSNNVKADMFVSVHIDSAESKSAGGTSVLYNTQSDYRKAPYSDLTSYRLASKNLDTVLDTTNFTGRNERLVERNELSVLRNSTTASSLIETGFISNKKEAQWISNNTDKIGKAVYQSILNATSAYPTSK